MSTRADKIIGKGDLVCFTCAHAKGSTCHHPKFKGLRAKPLIIAEQGDTYPAFCPLEKHEAQPLPGDAAPPPG
jgi:hypothetical protein